MMLRQYHDEDALKCAKEVGDEYAENYEKNARRGIKRSTKQLMLMLRYICMENDTESEYRYRTDENWWM